MTSHHCPANMDNMTTTETAQTSAPWGVLHDYLTGDDLGPATEAQFDASLNSGDGDEGIFPADAEGCPIDDDHYWSFAEYTNVPARRLYVASR